MLLARNFGWSVKDMENLTPSRLKSIVEELQKQLETEKVVDYYNKWAFLFSTVVNGFNSSTPRKTKPKVVKPKDFMSKEAFKLIDKIDKEVKIKTNQNWKNHIKEARAKDIPGPW